MEGFGDSTELAATMVNEIACCMIVRSALLDSLPASRQRSFEPANFSINHHFAGAESTARAADPLHGERSYLGRPAMTTEWLAPLHTD